LCITPNKNLVTNIGFGPDATHTKNINDKSIASRSTSKIFPLKHAREIFRDRNADEYVFLNSMGGSDMTIFKRIIRKIKSTINIS